MIQECYARLEAVAQKTARFFPVEDDVTAEECEAIFSAQDHPGFMPDPGEQLTFTL